MTRILVTGAAGFVGHHFVEHLLKNTDWQIVILDKLSYASSGKDRLVDIKAVSRTLADFQQTRVEFHSADLTQPISVGMAKEIGSVDYIVHMAAETHVDNSIVDPGPFVMANVVGTYHILEFARKLNSRLKRFVYFSTDEVFGPACTDTQAAYGDSLEEVNGYSLSLNSSYAEWDRYNSANPYSATKAGGEELSLSYANTFRMPIIITHCMNAYGERQHPEKFIPKVVRKLLQDELIYVHSDATKTVSGSRSYIHCRNIADAVTFLLKLEHVNVKSGVQGLWRDKFNIVGEREISNGDLVYMIADKLSKIMDQLIVPHIEMVDFHSSRPGHDLRYALDGAKMKSLGWTPPVTFEESLERTVRWMVDPKNIKWLLMEKEAVH